MVLKDEIELRIIYKNGNVRTVFGTYTTFNDGAGSLSLDETGKELFDNCKSIHVTIPTSIRVDSVYSILYQLDEYFYLNELSYEVNKQLKIPYFPYARADRSFDGNPIIPKRSFIEFLDMLEYDNVFSDDIHSNNHITPNSTYRKTGIDFFSSFIDVSMITQLNDIIESDKKIY